MSNAILLDKIDSLKEHIESVNEQVFVLELVSKEDNSIDINKYIRCPLGTLAEAIDLLAEIEEMLK